jgi:hypothetical protein
VRPDSTWRLRYCRAGNELVSFDEAGKVEHNFDASGFVHHAPPANPLDPSAFIGVTDSALEEQLDALGRDRLLKQFLDGLVTGTLTEVSQLDTMALARGADRIEPSVHEAMRRMVRNSPHRSE